MAVRSRGKFSVQQIARHAYNPEVEEVTLDAVSEAEWSQYTPQGELNIRITNPELVGKMELGETYYLDLIPVDASELKDQSVSTLTSTLAEIEADLEDVPQMARGGIVTRPTLAMVGELGPESVLPLNGRSAGTVVNIYYEFTVDGDVYNIEDLREQIIEWVNIDRLRGGEVIV